MDTIIPDPTAVALEHQVGRSVIAAIGSTLVSYLLASAYNRWVLKIK
jgi:hypothetical protein